MLLVSAEGPKSWLIQNSNEVAQRAERLRPATCPATCSSRPSKPAPEAVAQDDAIVRPAFLSAVVHSYFFLMKILQLLHAVLCYKSYFRYFLSVLLPRILLFISTLYSDCVVKLFG